MEHYISHIIDMRGVEFGTTFDLHGIQCGIATVTSLRLYEKLREIEQPDKEVALRFVQSFQYENWAAFLRKHLGKSAEAMIALEEKEHKYDPASHEKRLNLILENWSKLREFMMQLPTAAQVENLLRSIGAPTRFEEIGITAEEEKNAILMSKDIRDKYVGTRLLWDLGLLDWAIADIG